MKATKYQLLGNLLNIDRRVFKIPVYQRNYDWQIENCKRFMLDVEEIMKGRKERHFMGAMVMVHSQEESNAMFTTYIIIDGQQRLTTMTLLLKAMLDKARAMGDSNMEAQLNESLHNRFGDVKNKVKLKPINSDNEKYAALLNGTADIKTAEGNIFTNYRYFRDYLEKLIVTSEQLQNLYNSLFKLEVIGIDLDPREDDPQVIFESINSTGLDLTPADMIRNFLLMSASNQEELFSKYWMEMERLLRPEDGTYTNMNDFFVAYIICKTRQTCNSKKMYDEFVKLFKRNGLNREQSLVELLKYAKLYYTLIEPNDSPSLPSNVRMYLCDLKLLNQSTCYPFLLHVFRDYQDGLIQDIDLEKILHLLVSYMVRRMVCGVPSNSLRSLFSALYNRVFRRATNKDNYYDAICMYMHHGLAGVSDKLRRDDEFAIHLRTENVYRNKALCRYLLYLIENEGVEKLKPGDDITLEHIMPQSLSPEWQSCVTTEEHERYVNCLGNITLTGKNAELSNKSFKEKKVFYRTSKAVVLNKTVLECDSWGVADIERRSKLLCDTIVSRLRVECVSNPNVVFAPSSCITALQPDQATGKLLQKAVFRDIEFSENKFALLLCSVTRWLYELHPDTIRRLAKAGQCGCATSSARLRQPEMIAADVYIQLHGSASALIKRIATLLQACEYEPEDFEIYLRPKGGDDNL